MKFDNYIKIYDINRSTLIQKNEGGVINTSESFRYEDFFPRVERTIENGRTKRFLKRWAGDDALFLRVNNAPVTLEASSFYKTASSKGRSLEDIFLTALKARREIAFTGIIDEGRRRVVAFLRGKLGSYGMCDWTKGPLLKKSFELVKDSNYRIMLGHTHPPLYGPICSNIKSAGEQFGDDYREILERIRSSSLISRFHIIMTPSHNMIGIFELREKGVLVYHPWHIANSRP